MKRIFCFLNKKFLIAIISISMTSQIFSQEMPVSDIISTSKGAVEMDFIGHGSLMFKLNNFIIHIDPLSSVGDYSKMPKADLILVTHEHGDHLDTAAINKIKKSGTVLICNQSSFSNVPWAQVMNNGDKKIINGITIEAVPAYNIKNESAPGKPFHPKGNGNGYVITIGDKQFYVAGDTENVPEMKNLKNIDVAFLPMNLPYTMSPEMAAEAARMFNPKILYPYHYGNTKTDELINLLKNTTIEVRIRKLI
jgi:L-ascorbate metabolism protein UlaG (beta-lactamase superfamily)